MAFCVALVVAVVLPNSIFANSPNFTHVTHANTLNASDTQKVGFYIDGREKTNRIPIKVVNNLVVVSMKMNGDLNLNFIIDTGVKVPIILDTTLQSAFANNYQRTIQVKGLGPEDAIDAKLVLVRNIEMASLRAAALNFVIIPTDVFDISEHLGIRVHGIIGYEFFRNFKVEIDYENEWLRLYSHNYQLNKLKMRAFEKLPIVLENNKPFCRVTLQNNGKKREHLKMLVDSGASGAVSFITSTIDGLSVPEPNVWAHLGTGLSGDIHGQIGRVTAIEFEDFVFNNVVTAFPDTLSMRHVNQLTSERNGSIGGEILKRFRVIYDYRNKVIFLKKNHKFKQDFEYNKSGLTIRAKGRNLTHYIIEKIDANSSADKAGLMVGDQILSIDNIQPKELSLNKIYDIVSVTKVGRTLRFRILRKGKLMTVKMKVYSVI